MKNIILITIASILASCGGNHNNYNMDRYIVETTVHLQPGKTKEVLELFISTNPALVAGEKDWIRASISAVDDEDIIIVRADWKSKTSYLNFSNSSKFKETMGQFGKFFAGQPQVVISKVLFEM